MATHRIGRGTVNVPINLLTEERAMLGKLAIFKDSSLGGFIRHLTIEGLRREFPEHAARIAALRREHRSRDLQEELPL